MVSIDIWKLKKKILINLLEIISILFCFDKEIITILKEDDLVGLNITTPYKEKIILHIDNKLSIKKTHGAVNFVTINKPGKPNNSSDPKISGENTDTIGFKRALHKSRSTDIFYKQDCCAIVLGYGGAAKAIIYTLVNDLNFKNIIVFNRTFDKIKNLKKAFFLNQVEPQKLENLSKNINKAQLIINTTPANMLIGPTKWDINPNCVGFDIVYRPWDGTGFLKHFKKENRIEGIHMLIHQAAPCFKEWFGVEPDTKDMVLLKTLFNKMNKK